MAYFSSLKSIPVSGNRFFLHVFPFHTINPLKCFIICTMLMVWGVGSVSGVIYTSVSSGNWSTPGTWSGGAVPNNINGNSVVIAAGFTVKLSSATTWNQAITVNSGGTLDLNGNTLSAPTPFTLNGTGVAGIGALINSNGTLVTFASDITGTYSLGGTGSITLTGNVQGTLTKIGTNTLTLGGTVDNVGLGVIANSGTLILAKTSDTNHHAIGGGNLTIAGATVQLGGSGGDQIYDPSTLTINSGTFDLHALSETINTFTGTNGTILNNGGGTSTLTYGAGGGTNTYSGVIANGTGVLSLIQSGGTYTLSGTNTYSGSTTVNGGTLKAGSNQSFGSNSAITLANTTGVGLDITGFNNTIGSLTGGGATGGNVSLGAATLTIGSDGTSPAAYAGIISGTGSIIKSGTGTLILSGANTYTGTTTISTGGTLKLGVSSSSGSAGPLGATGAGTTTISSGGVLDLNGFSLTGAANEQLTLYGTGISNNGALINSSATAATYSGAITLASVSSIGTTGDITLGGGITGGFDLTKVGGATLNLGSSTATLGALTISAGTLTSTSGTLNLSGNFTNNGTFNHNSGTVNFNGTSNINGSAASTSFNTLSLSGSANVSTGIATIVGGNLTINNGTTFNAAGYGLTVTGITTVGSGTSGTLNITSATGAKLFTGLVTVASGATWNNNVNSPVEFQGGITNSGTAFTAGSGVYTFDINNSQILTGTLSIPNVTVNSPTVLTNNGILTVGTALSGTGGLTQGGTAALNIAGTCGINTLNASAGTNTVSYTNGYQNAFPTTYYNLTLSGNTMTFATPPTVNGTLDLQLYSTITITGGGPSVIYGPNATLKYDWSNSTIVSSVEWPSPFTASGGVIINSSQSYQINGPKVFNTSIPLTINAGATLISYGYKLTLGGDFIKNGTFNAGNPVDLEITGTANQNIAGFNTNGGNFLNTKTSGTATLTGAVTSGSFNLTGTGLSLGSATHTAGTLYLGGAGQPAGSWGGSGSAATFKNSTYFAPAVTGIINVTTKSCTSGSWVGITNTDWNTASNWCDGTVPTSATNVIINPVVNQPVIGAGVSANCNSLTINSGAILTTASGTNSLTVSGGVTINSGATLTISGTNTLTVGNGNWTNNGGTFAPGTGTVIFNAAINFAINGTATNQTFNNINENYTGNATLSVGGSTTTLNVLGNFTQSNGHFTAPATMTIGGDLTLASSLAAYHAFIAGTNLTVGGNWIHNNGTFTPGTNTVTMTGATTTIGGSASTTFNNLSVSGTAAVSTAIATTIGGNLNIGDGSTFTAGGFALTVTGTTTIGGGTSGNLIINSATGTKLFNGQVTIANNAIWNNSGNSPLEFRGGITNDPTDIFTAGSGLQTFTTNAQALSGGTFSIPNMTVTGVTLTNNNTLTVATALGGTGGLTQATGATLTIGGTSGITTLTATNSGNTVNFTGAAQTVNPTNYYNLSLSGSGAKAMSGITSIINNFSMGGSATATPVITSIGGAVDIEGTAVYTTGANNAVTGSLTVGTGATLSLGGFSLGIGTSTSITGTVNTVTAATGTKTFSGAVTINSGGVWNLSGQNPATSFGGGITMSGATFNNGTGVAAFSATQSFLGANAMTFGGSVTPATSTTLTNSNSGTVTINNIALTGNFTQGSNLPTLALVNATPFSGAGTFDASSNSNTVIYTGTSPTVKAVTYSNLTINGSGTATIGGITAVNGTMTVTSATTNNSSLTVTTALSGAGTLTQGASSTLNIGGTSGITTLDASTNANTVNYTGGAQTVKAIAYKTLGLSGSGVKTMTGVTTIGTDFNMSGSATATPLITTVGGNININGSAVMITGANNAVTGSLTVGTGATLSLSGFSLGIGTTSSITGTVNTVTSATGTKTFTGAVTINSGGVWNLSGQNPATSFGGGIIMNGTSFNNGTGAAAFSSNQSLFGGNAMIFGGNVIPALSTTLTNSNSSTVTINNIVLTGSFTQGLNSPTLALVNSAPFSGAGTFDASSNNNTVNYIGGAQTVKGVNYINLGISGGGSSIKTLGGGGTVSGTLTIAASTTLAFGTTAQTLILSGSGTNTLSNSGTIDMSTGPNAAHLLQIAALSNANFGTLTPGTGSTIEYTVSSGGQFINPATYNNLKIDNSGNSNTASGNLTINGTLTTTAGGTLNLGTNQLLGTLVGVTNGGTILTQNTNLAPIPTGKTWGGTVTFNGVSAQNIPASTFANLTLNNTAGAGLAGVVTVSGNLTLTNGILGTTTTNYLAVTNTASGAVTGSSSSNYINGPLRWSLANGNSYFFPVGDATNYRPFELNSITASSPVVLVSMSSAGASSVDGTTLSSVAPRNWYTQVMSGTLSNATVRITENGLGNTNAVASSTAQAGPYISQGGNNIVSTITSAPGISYTTPSYFAIGTIPPAVALSDNGTQVTAATIAGGTSNVVLHQSALTVTLVDATLSGMSCTTAGTYASADITNLKVWYQTSNIFNASTAVLLSTLTTPGTAGLKTFPSFTPQGITIGATGYLFITADIAPGAIVGNTVNLSALTTGNFTFNSATKSGSTTAGGVQTFTVSTYYNKSSGASNLEMLSNWGTNADGTGTSPANFTTANQIFNIQNGTSVTIGSAWTVSGANSKVVLGNLSIDAIAYTIPSVYAFTGTIDIAAATSGSNTLIIQSTTIPTFGTLSAGSTVNYNGAAQTVTGINYSNSNLILSGTGVKTLQPGTTSIGGNLTLSGNATTTTAAGLTIGGNLAIGNGTTFATASNYILSVSGTTGISGTYTDGSTGAKTFTGDISLNGGGIWNETAVSTYLIAGNFTNNGTTFTASTGVHTFSGAAMSLSGGTATSIPNVTFSGTYTNYSTLTAGTLLMVTSPGILTNNATINAATALSGTGELIQGTTGVLTIGGTSTITTLTATAVGNNVNFNGAGSQNLCKVTTYDNLTLSGSGTKTFATTPTVNDVLSMEGTSTVVVTTGAITYGTNATLQYNTATSRTAGVEWLSSFATTGGIIVANTGTITMNSIEIVNAPLTINSGATLATNNLQLTLGDNFMNNGGTFTAGSSPIIISGTANQNIDGFTTTGLVSMTKTSGTATLTNNVNGAGLTINGSGGTLNLGVGLIHTFTGVVTLSAGTLNGGSSMLNENATSPTAWNGNGSLFIAGTGTVTFGGGNQTLSSTATTFNNIILGGTGTKTFSSTNITTTNGDFSIFTGVTANLGTGITHTAKTLTLSGSEQTLGYWGGGTNAPAATRNTVYFTNNGGTSGLLNVSSCDGLWIGGTSGATTDWNTGTNWCSNTVPNASTNVTINNTTYKPVIGTFGGVCNNLTINNGSSLTVNASSTLTIYGNVTLSGTGSLAPNAASTVNYSGTNQTVANISGNYGNLTFSNSGIKTYTVAAAKTANVLTVASSVTLLLNGTNSLKPVSAAINGTVAIQNTASLVNGTGTISFASGSTYQHGVDGGTIPTATWDINSTCLITGITTNEPSGDGQAFGNLTYNCSGMTANVNMSGAAQPIAGNFTVLNTGTGQLRMSQSTLLVNGNCIISDNFRIGSGTSRTLNVLGDFTLNGGILDMCSGGSGYSGTLNLAGNLSVLSGSTLTESGTGTALGAINFNGSSPQVYTSGGTVSNIINFTVNAGAILQMGTGSSPSTITGAGSFTLSSGATLGITSPVGISAIGTASGNIQTTTARTFAAGANYIYNGTTPQVTGTGLTQNTPANLTINNSTGVTLSAASSASGILTLLNGTLTTASTNLLSITNTATTAITGGTATSFINGPVLWTLPVNLVPDSTYNFPVGKGTTYLPFSLVNPTTGSSATTAKVEAFATGSGGSLGTGISALSTTEYWKLITSGSYTSSSVSIARPTAISPSTVVATSTSSLNSAYSNLGGTFDTYGVYSSNATTNAATQFFVFATGNVPSMNVSTNTLYGFNYVVGNGPSTELTFKVSGISLTGNITVTPSSTNYEISTVSGGIFQTTPLTITPISGKVSATIYVREVGGLSVGNYQGLFTVSTPQFFTPQSVNCYGSVVPVITVGGGGSYCVNNPINLTSAGGISQYWEGPNSFYSTEQNPQVTANATLANSGIYTVTASTPSGTNLVINGDFETGNNSGNTTTDYVYYTATTGVLATGGTHGNNGGEGRYTVVGNPQNVHGSFTNCPPQQGNYQMVINGSSYDNENVWRQTVSTGITKYTNYQFSYYVQSVTNTNPSELQLYVNDIPAGPIYSASGTNCVQKYYTYNWYSGSNTTAVLRLVNRQTAIGGNDFALDNIRFEQNYTSTASVNVTVIPTGTPASVSVAASANPINSGQSVTFTATPTNGGNNPLPTYQWSVSGVTKTGATSDVFTYIPTNGDVVSCTMTPSSSSCYVGSAVSSSVTMTVNSVKNLWIGTNGTNWGNPTNWTAGYVPAKGDNVEFATIFNNYGSQAVNNLILDTDRKIGNLTNATSPILQLIIPPARCLTVNGSIITLDNDPGRIYIQAYQDGTQQNGTLIFNNGFGTPACGNVEMYSMAYKSSIQDVNGQYYKWQYFGIPIDGVTANPTFYGSYVRRWDESGTTISNHWVSVDNTYSLQPGIGYELTQNVPKTIVFKGRLRNWDWTSPQLSYTFFGINDPRNGMFPGQQILSNPFTAAIDITKIVWGSDMQQTVWLYSTGSMGDWAGSSNAGQYTAAVPGLSGLGMTSQIPSMQGMLVQFKPGITASSTSSWVKFPYSSVVKNLETQRVKGTFDSSSSDNIGTRIDVTGSVTSDKMWLFSQKECTHKFDNGWDGTKEMGSALTPQIFAIEQDGNYQIDAVDDINNTYLGFQAGQDKEYTLTFTHQNLKTKYSAMYLFDMTDNKTVDITESGTTYSFTAESTPTSQKRFIILTRNIGTDSIGNITQLKVFNSGNAVFVDNVSGLSGDIAIYDMTGRILKTAKFEPYGITAIQTGVITGAYIVKAANTNERVSKRIILGN